MHDLWQERGGTQNVSGVEISFKVSEMDNKTAICNGCSASVMRGGAKTKSFNTTNLINHLKNRHLDRYKEGRQERGHRRRNKTSPAVFSPSLG